MLECACSSLRRLPGQSIVEGLWSAECSWSRFVIAAVDSDQLGKWL